MNNKFTWRTAAIQRETAQALTIRFDTGKTDFQYRPGQFVNITIPINGQPVTRSYSLSSVPSDDAPSITVKKQEDGLMSGYICSKADRIADWEVDGPHGFFYPGVQADKANSIVLIAGGSGITPLYAQLKHFLHHTNKRLVLINVNRDAADAIFYTEIRRLANIHSDRLTVADFFTQGKSEDTAAENQFRGRPGKLVLRKLLSGLLGNEARQACYFICGPAGLIELAEQAARALEVPDENIHKEFFGTNTADKPEVELPGTALEVILHHPNGHTKLNVQPGVSILHAALEAGLAVRNSCKKGYCGACIGRLLQGAVHMKQNHALYPTQTEQGYVLLCQSHPLSNETAIRVDSLR